jgi:hypothetical protein
MLQCVLFIVSMVLGTSHLCAIKESQYPTKRFAIIELFPLLDEEFASYYQKLVTSYADDLIQAQLLEDAQEALKRSQSITDALGVSNTRTIPVSDQKK